MLADVVAGTFLAFCLFIVATGTAYRLGWHPPRWFDRAFVRLLDYLLTPYE